MTEEEKQGHSAILEAVLDGRMNLDDLSTIFMDMIVLGVPAVSSNIY